MDLSFSSEDTGISPEKYYCGNCHEKVPSDAEIGVLKRYANLAVKGRVTVIVNAQDLFEYAKWSVTKPLAIHTATAAGPSFLAVKRKSREKGQSTLS